MAQITKQERADLYDKMLDVLQGNYGMDWDNEEDSMTLYDYCMDEATSTNVDFEIQRFEDKYM